MTPKIIYILVFNTKSDFIDLIILFVWAEVTEKVFFQFIIICKSLFVTSVTSLTIMSHKSTWSINYPLVDKLQPWIIRCDIDDPQSFLNESCIVDLLLYNLLSLTRWNLDQESVGYLKSV